MRLRDRYRLWRRRRAYRQYGLSESEIDSLIDMKLFEARREALKRKSIELQQQAATKGDRRSIGVLLSHLFCAIPDPDTGQSYSSDRVAQLTEGRLSKDWIEAVRQRRDVKVSRSDLIALSAFFRIDHCYWEVEVEDEELEPEVRQARREHRSAKLYPEEGEMYAGHRLFMSDLRALVQPENCESVQWTPEEIEQATHGDFKAEQVLELLDADEPSPRFDHMRAMAEDIYGQPYRVWFEGYFTPDEMNNLIR